MRYFIAGPCAIESVASFVAFADTLVQVFEQYPELQLVYKGSFDKANRSLKGSPRGVGLVDAELAWLKLRENHPGLLVTTDIHETWQAQVVAPHIDVIQIPAMLARQTSLIMAAVETGRTVNIKCPTTQPVGDFIAAAQSKTDYEYSTWYTYRGTACAGQLVVDMHEVMDLWGTTPNGFLDLTHTNRTDRWRSVNMARMAAALRGMNFFAEVHPSPDTAICDGANQLSRRALQNLLNQISDNAGSV